MRNSERKYKCIVIDDDPNGIEVIKEHIALVPKLALVKTYLDPIKAIKELKDIKQVDFLFLDINMQLSGLDVAKLLRNKVRYIIFVTGHPEHALAAFRVEADRFLPKPIGFAKFLTTVNELLYHRVKIRSLNK